MSAAGPYLMLVTRPPHGDDDLVRLVAAAVSGGVNLVQLRDKGAPIETVIGLASRLRDAIDGRASLLVNHPRWAEALGVVDGVHLPEGETPDPPRLSLPPSLIRGRSVHSVDAARAAEADGSDYAVAGTIFASASHPGEAAAGIPVLRNVCASVTIPVLAIGGVTPWNAAECLRAGAAGVAVLSTLMDAEDPGAVAAAYRAAMAEVCDVADR